MSIDYTIEPRPQPKKPVKVGDLEVGTAFKTNVSGIMIIMKKHADHKKVKFGEETGRIWALGLDGVMYQPFSNDFVAVIYDMHINLKERT